MDFKNFVKIEKTGFNSLTIYTYFNNEHWLDSQDITVWEGNFLLSIYGTLNVLQSSESSLLELLSVSKQASSQGNGVFEDRSLNVFFRQSIEISNFRAWPALLIFPTMILNSFYILIT